MRLFRRGRSSAAVQDNFDYDAAVRELEAPLLAKADDVLANMMERHNRDVASWHFECRRWGDFLSLMAERENQTHVAAINLNKMTAAVLLHGHVPDREGWTAWYGECGTVTRFLSKREMQERWAPKLWVDAEPDSCDSSEVSFWPRHTFNHITRGLPRAQQDDRVVFTGIGTLFCPVGMGDSVLAAVLQQGGAI